MRKRALLLILALGVFLAVWAFVWEPRRLAVREQTYTLSCWRGKPIRVALVSDLHTGSPHNGVETLDRVVAATNAGRPDMIVLLGDFVIQGIIGGDFVPPERIARSLANLRAPLGVYAVLGNHDWWYDGPRVQRALQSVGITTLEDATIRIRTGGDAFWLAGVSDFIASKHDVAKAVAAIDGDEPAIAITHNPDVFPEMPQRICLTLAGHTHGGQVALPIVGRPIVPSRYGQRYAIGRIHEHGRDLFVTTGVGMSILPVRFRVPPEIVFLRIGR